MNNLYAETMIMGSETAKVNINYVESITILIMIILASDKLTIFNPVKINWMKN